MWNRTRVALVAIVALTAGLLFVGRAAAAGPRPDFQLPFPCGQEWTGANESDAHRAWEIDFNRDDDYGDPVVAAAAGAVTRARYETVGGFGNHIVIDHGGGWLTHYAHLSDMTVEAGDTVGRGDQIGNVGDTTATHPNMKAHLHYEVRTTDTGYPENIQKATFNGAVFGYPRQTLTSRNCPEAPKPPSVLRAGESGMRFDGAYHTFFQSAGNQLTHHVYNTGWATYNASGTIASRPTTVLHAGTMYVFARGVNGFLQYLPRKLRTGWADRWFEVNYGGFTGAPGVGVAGDTMFVLVHSGQEVFYLTNNAESGWQTGGWRGLEKPPTAAVASDPVVAVHDGRMFVFVRGSDNQIWVRSYRPADRKWSTAWTKLAGAAVTGRPTAAVHDNTLWVYARTATGDIRYHTYTAGATSWGLDYGLDAAVASDPSAINAGDRMTIAARSPQGTVVYRVREANKWSGWLTLASPPPPTPLDGVSTPVLGRLEGITLVNVRTRTGALHIRNYSSDTGWGASWGTLPGNHSPIT